MRLHSLLLGGLSLSAFFLFASGSTTEGQSEEPVLDVVAAFPEENPFGHVVNGEQNRLLLTIINKSDRNVTLTSMGGAFLHPETNALIKNTSIAKIEMPFPSGSKIILPYVFHSEFKTGDLRLNVWLEHATGDDRSRVVAYDSIVTIVEPEGSIFDLKTITAYLIVAALLSALGHFAYLSFAPPPKRQRAKRPIPTPSEPVTVTASGAGYQEEWIPVHHLKKGKSAKAVSGDELSGGETSGTEGRKRKGKK